eukprot:370423-Amphidinium_carterae.1
MTFFTGLEVPLKPTMVYAKYAFMPMPGHRPKGKLAHKAIISVATQLEAAVAKTKPSKLRPV